MAHTPHDKTVPILEEPHDVIPTPERHLTLLARTPALLALGVGALFLFSVLSQPGLQTPLLMAREGMVLALNITETRLKTLSRGVLLPIGKLSATVFCATRSNDVECSRVSGGKF